MSKKELKRKYEDDLALYEDDLASLSKQGKIEVMWLLQREDGKFEIRVCLKEKETFFFLKTQRGWPRAWTSLDKLIRHITNSYGEIKKIKLNLKWS
jgi:hypothetical protein